VPLLDEDLADGEARALLLDASAVQHLLGDEARCYEDFAGIRLCEFVLRFFHGSTAAWSWVVDPGLIGSRSVDLDRRSVKAK
jgi:hypothetical protein